MSFDPEKARRWCPFPEGTAPAGWPEEYVSAAAYDQLLALYREATESLLEADSELNGEPGQRQQ